MDLTETGFGIVDWIHMAQDSVEWCTTVEPLSLILVFTGHLQPYLT